MIRHNQTHFQFVRYGVICSAIVTALIHIFLSFRFADGPDPIFLSNGIGYLVLVGALYLPVPGLNSQRVLLRWILMGYAALTIGLWLFWGARTPIAYFDKFFEIVLIVLLWLENQHRP